MIYLETRVWSEYARMNTEECPAHRPTTKEQPQTMASSDNHELSTNERRLQLETINMQLLPTKDHCEHRLDDE